MKTKLARMICSAFVVAGLALALSDSTGFGSGLGAQPPAEEERCGGSQLPKCATIEACKGILWWKKCVKRSIYFPDPR